MVRSGTLGEKVAAWAATEPSVQALVLFGSRVRAADEKVWAADAQSDWDFAVIGSQAKLFADARWAHGLGLPIKAYAVRTAQIGGVPKIAVVFVGAEADFVIQPAGRLRLARGAMALGLHRRAGRLQRTLQDLAVVIRPGWKFLKGGEAWEPFYRRVVDEVPDPRLTEAEARMLAEGFVCDVIWTHHKIERGELLAAQRMIHRSLAEINFRLLHELRLRRGERSFPEARRIERVGQSTEIASVAVVATPDAVALREAANKCSATLRDLMRALAPDWRWPL